FGQTGDATIKNVHLTNVSLKTTDARSSYPNGALIGTAYRGTVVDNVSVKGHLTTRTITGGVVGSLSPTATINNAHADINIAAEDYTYSFATGGLVGGASGDISNSSSKGTIAGNKKIGGLVGDASQKITDSHSSVNIIVQHPENEYISSWENIGGLVGEYKGSTISRSYATGMVDASANNVGGLVGSLGNNSKVIDSYARGNVTGINNVGGLVGINKGATIASSYATGAVSGDSSSGGLVGQDSNGVYNAAANFYDKDKTNMSDTKGATGESTANMQNRATFTGWNFTDTWKANKNAYPTLRDEPFNLLTDIGSSFWGRDDITEIIENDIMSGSSDSAIPGKFVFRPSDDITRAEFAIVIVNALGESASGSSTDFTDDSAIPSWAKAEV